MDCIYYLIKRAFILSGKQREINFLIFIGRLGPEAKLPLAYLKARDPTGDTNGFLGRTQLEEDGQKLFFPPPFQVQKDTSPITWSLLLPLFCCEKELVHKGKQGITSPFLNLSSTSLKPVCLPSYNLSRG